MKSAFLAALAASSMVFAACDEVVVRERVPVRRHYVTYVPDRPYYHVHYEDERRPYYRRYYYEDAPTYRVERRRYYYRPRSRVVVRQY